MKRSIFLFICLLSLSSGLCAQVSDTFDIATFTIPSGWKKQSKDGAVVFTTLNESKGSFALVTVYRSGDSSGSAKTDFENDWQEFIATQLGVKARPRLDPVNKVDGWETISGVAAFENEMGITAVILKTFSGHGRSISFAAVFNSQDHRAAIEGFASSIKLTKPRASAQPGPAADTVSAGIIGTWGVSHSDQSTFRVNNAVMSYIAREYSFNADGTYRFISKAFDPFSTKLLFGKEVGTYRVAGDLLTIVPKSSVLEGWSRKNNSDQLGTRLDSQNRILETVTYRFTKHYFSGIQKTSLILIADKPTQRDGPFSGGTAFNNAWIYSPPCQQCFIEMPR